MNRLLEKDFKKIIARRDKRFDGRFYFGVKTTGIYCRPVCPAKPKPENIVVFKSASEAEQNGFRPCLRCHPDSAPGNKVWDGAVHAVWRALRILHDAPDRELTVAVLAETLGITDRHLRRLFIEHLGATPIEVLITQRLHFAKQAIHETSTPITDIAFASGFQSIRRFNEAFKARFHRSPSEFRRAKALVRSTGLSLRVPIRRPYDWKTVMAYLKRHEVHGIESIENGVYRRFVTRKNSFGTVVVREEPGRDFLAVEFINIPLQNVRYLLSRVKNLFDTDHNPVHLPTLKADDVDGIRVPGSFDPFETAVSIGLSQLVSTDHAKAKLNALVQRFGRSVGKGPSGEVFEFPSPTVLATARVETLGVTKIKAGAIRAFARAVRDGSIDFNSHLDVPTVAGRLLSIKGIGPWTAAMIAMRCLGDPDAFPELDLIVQRAVKGKRVDPVEWASSRAYLTHYIWREFGGTSRGGMPESRLAGTSACQRVGDR